MVSNQLGTVLRQLCRIVDDKSDDQASDHELLQRFVTERDERAFIGLMRRNGPMILCLGGRLQSNGHDAEDVFQATFLLLARKAGSIRKYEAVSSWLHGVAYRLAVAARSQAARRQERERRAADTRNKPALSDKAWRELQAMLEEALRQVPDLYRAPLHFCYLEGQTQEAAARQLGCPLGTVQSRLARGR